MKTKICMTLCLLTILINLTCGLEETIPVLSRPGTGNTSEIDKYFQFRMTESNGCTDCDQNEEEFRGFEIYYRFLSTNSSPVIYETVSDLVANAFKRISYYITNDDCDTPTRIYKPLIPVPQVNRGCRTLFTIDFADMTQVNISAVNEDTRPGKVGLSEIRGEEHLELRRGIEDTDNPGYLKSFKDFKLTDPDVLGISTLAENSVYIALYVVSYGKYNISETVYSETLFLGIIDLDEITIIE